MKFLKRLIMLILLVIVGIGGFLLFQGYDKYQTAIEHESLKEKIAQIYKNDNFTALEDLPDVYKDAVIAVEDRRFYFHHGLDYIGISRALLNAIKNGEFREGGSSITQQLAKNLYFEGERSAERKIAEIFLAKDIEAAYKKAEILELYVNTIYFGNGYYGIGEASQGYYGKNPKKLTKKESTMLAGIPNAPSAYALNKHPKKAKERQKQVLKRMVKNGYLTEKEAQNILEDKG